MVDDQRTAGSPTVFDNEWRSALASGDTRLLIYPSKTNGRQADLFEWIKAQQIVEILKQYGINSGTVLEYGCGSAGMSLFLTNIGYRCTICDLSVYAIKLAHSNQSHHGLQDKIIPGSVANALRLPYANNSVDVIMSFGLLEHFELEPLAQLINESKRVLKPGGIFIADIIPGPKKMNARTLGILISYSGSMAANFFSGKWSRIPQLYHQYFDFFYESTLNDREWEIILKKHGFADIKINVCRPFPPLAISGKAEEYYTRFMLKFLTFHEKFDRMNNRLTRRWGWMYLARGRKPGENK
jgi:ubiquinone/menaquinone biosynthesis C-methylase UbiE